jgi:hypothetical protein
MTFFLFFFAIFKQKNFFLKINSCQKNYFKNFFRFFRQVKNPSVLRKNFFAPNYNTVYNCNVLNTLYIFIVKRIFN